MTHSEVHLTIQTLRLYLLDLCRLSQRCVDYCIKAYQQGRPDMIANVRDNTLEINLLHSDTTAIAQDLLLKWQMPHGRNLRFVLSSMMICDALRSIHNSTVEIASNTMRFWGNGGDFALTDLPEMGDSVNRLVQLCAESLIEEAIEAAQMVLYSDCFEREFVTKFYEWYRTIDHEELAQAHCALALTRHLSQIVQHAREIADAIVFWLDYFDDEPGAETGEIDLLKHLTPESICICRSGDVGSSKVILTPDCHDCTISPNPRVGVIS